MGEGRKYQSECFMRGLLDFIKKHLPCKGENGSSAAFKQSTGTLMVCNGLVWREAAL